MFERFFRSASWEGDAIDGYRYALSLTGNPHDAEDLTQEAIARLYRAYGGPRHKGQLYRTIRNIYFDQWRRRKIVSIESIEELESNEMKEDSRWDAKGEALDIASALDILRPEERELLFLRYKNGYSSAEIAELTGKGRGTVCSLLNRAEKKMRAYMRLDDEKGAIS